MRILEGKELDDALKQMQEWEAKKAKAIEDAFQINYFTEEQVKELEKNPYVKKVSNKSITYAEEFKELYWIDYQNGIQPIEIFKKYGFDPNVLGAKRRNTFTERLKKQTQRVEGFNSGRPSAKELSLEEQIERLKHKNKVLQ